MYTTETYECGFDAAIRAELKSRIDGLVAGAKSRGIHCVRRKPGEAPLCDTKHENLKI